MKGTMLPALKCALLVLVLVLTNKGLGDRLHVLWVEQRVVTMVVFVAIWLMALAGLLAASFHPSTIVRLTWAVPLSIAGAAAYGFHAVQGSEFFIFDVVNFWAARHEAGRAMEFFSDAVLPTLAVFCLSLLVIAMPAGTLRPSRRVRIAAALLPALPIVLIALVVVYREGKGSNAMPKQFSPISLAGLAAYKLGTGSYAAREPVAFKPGKPLVRALVMMVDESIRADFVSLEPGNAVTPLWAAENARWIDFGPAVSSGNCSHISNAMLRFMAERRNLVRSVVTSPTVWQYAKAAGFRTVFIDAQAGFINVYGKLQNHMTPAEVTAIDRLHKLDESVPTWQLDDELMRITLEELAVGDRVFIYANKNGAHFPYINNSPGNEGAVPQGEAGVAGDDARTLASYAKAIAWSTDRTMAMLTHEADWQDMAVVYTSDHGQNFSPGRLTHCSSLDNVDAQEGIVPLMVATGDDALAARFAAVAQASPGRGSHFAIAPALLEMMGYAPPDIERLYDVSLLGGMPAKPQFVSDDIFGLFARQPTWHEADPFVQRGRADAEPTASIGSKASIR